MSVALLPEASVQVARQAPPELENVTYQTSWLGCQPDVSKPFATIIALRTATMILSR